MTQLNQGNTPDDGIIMPTYNPKLLGDYVKDVIGQHSLTAYANMSGLSLSYLSKLTNGKLASPPSKRTLVRLVNPMTGRRQGTITLIQLFEAAGYNPVETNEMEKIEEATKGIHAVAETTTFPLCLLLNMLLDEESMGANLQVDVRDGLYEVRGKGKHVVALPAFGAGTNDVKTSVKIVARALISVYGILDDDTDAIVYILTDDVGIYGAFEQYIKIPPDVEVRIALTEDYVSYNQIRTLQPVAG